MSHNTLLILGGALIVLLAALLFFVEPRESTAPTREEGTDQQSVAIPDTVSRFTCGLGKTLEAGFSDRLVQLTLSDGRSYTLEQTVSASGARYATEDDSFVFWHKGATASLEETEEDGTRTHSECVRAE